MHQLSEIGILDPLSPYTFVLQTTCHYSYCKRTLTNFFADIENDFLLFSFNITKEKNWMTMRKPVVV